MMDTSAPRTGDGVYMSAPFLVVSAAALPSWFVPIYWSPKPSRPVKGYRYLPLSRLYSLTQHPIDLTRAVVQADGAAPDCAADPTPVRVRVGAVNATGYFSIAFFDDANEAALSMGGPRYLIGQERTS